MVRTQNYYWQPGETLRHSEASRNTLPYTSTHKIMRILSQLEFPYFDAFTLGAIKEFAHQLFPFVFVHEIETLFMRKKLPKDVHSFTKPHAQDLPFLEPNEIKSQRLFPFQDFWGLDGHSVHLEIPRHHNFTPNLSRLKTSRHFPYLARYHIKTPTTSFSFNISI